MVDGTSSTVQAAPIPSNYRESRNLTTEEMERNGKLFNSKTTLDTLGLMPSTMPSLRRILASTGEVGRVNQLLQGRDARNDLLLRMHKNGKPTWLTRRHVYRFSVLSLNLKENQWFFDVFRECWLQLPEIPAEKNTPAMCHAEGACDKFQEVSQLLQLHLALHLASIGHNGLVLLGKWWFHGM